MDLSKFKYIINTKQNSGNGKPLFSPSGALSKVSNVLSKIPIAEGLSFASDLGNAFSTNSLPTEGNLSEGAGSSQGSINGVSYERRGFVNSDAQMDALKAQNSSNTLKAATSGVALGSSIGGPIGGVAGGILGLVGGILGGNSRKRKLEERIREANRLNSRINQFNASQANTEAMTRDYYNENDDNSSSILYLNRGKDMNKVWTPSGFKNGHINSMVGKGESIINFNRGTGALVTKGTRGVDNQPSSVKPNDDNIILGNDVDWTNGVKFSDQAAPLTARLQVINEQFKRTNKYDKMSSISKQTKNVQERELNRRRQPILDALSNISTRQEIQHQIENKAAYGAFDGGKDVQGITAYAKWPTFNWFKPSTVMDIDKSPINYTPKPVYSTLPKTESNTSDSTSKDNSGNSDLIPAWQRMFPSAFGLANAISQYNLYDKQPISHTNTYRRNPYAQEALRGMASLRYDMYPELQAIRNAERRGAYAINNSGGLSGGQRVAARIANTLGTQENLSNVYAKASNQNNQYKQNYYTTLMNAGQADRTARMSAAQQDYQNYVAAHGAKYRGRDTAVANMIDQVNNWYANEFKYKTYQDTANIYRQELDDKRKALAAGYNSSKATNNNPSTTTTNPATTTTNYSLLFPFMTQQPTQTFNTSFGSLPVWNNPLDWSFKNLMRYAR